MIIKETALSGAYLIELDKHVDERGFFARSWCVDEFKQIGLNPQLVQCNISFNKCKHTLRGMHYQSAPFAEAKLIRCTRGAIFDVIIDLRQDSKTFCQWYGVELNYTNHKMLFVPEGFAHGFLTLEDYSEVFYQMGQFYSPEHAKTVRWNDQLFNIKWPAQPQVMSPKDRDCPDSIPKNISI